MHNIFDCLTTGTDPLGLKLANCPVVRTARILYPASLPCYGLVLLDHLILLVWGTLFRRYEIKHHLPEGIV